MFTIFMILVLVTGAVAYQQGFFNNLVRAEEIGVGTEVGQLAPDFTLKNLDGEEVRLSDLKGKRVLLNFWASWCYYCRQEMPYLQELYQKHAEDVTVVTINLGEAKGTVSEFINENNYDFPVLLDSNREVTYKYLVRATPTNYFLDENGVITGKHIGAMTYDKMLESLAIKNEETDTK